MEKEKDKDKEEGRELSIDDKLDQIIEMKKSENSALKKIYASLLNDKSAKITNKKDKR